MRMCPENRRGVKCGLRSLPSDGQINALLGIIMHYCIFDVLYSRVGGTLLKYLYGGLIKVGSRAVGSQKC